MKHLKSGGLLDSAPPKPLPSPRTVASVAAELRALADGGQLDLPTPGSGRTAERWSALAGLGRRDLTLARLAEGHTDARAILAEAGHSPEPGALYGVWAARSGGTGARIAEPNVLTGTVRFCSGATSLDRALVVARDDTDGSSGSSVIVDVALDDPAVRPRPDTWPTIGMDASDSLDIEFAGLRFAPEQIVGPPGFYLDRRGFWLGGAGVAAVWLGGCAAVVDTVLAALCEHGHPDEHQCAELGGLHAALAAADAVLTQAARSIDAERDGDAGVLAQTCRSVLERTALEVLERAPRATGAAPLSRDRRFAQQLTDLQVYLRQHHGGKDLATLGRALLAAECGR